MGVGEDQLGGDLQALQLAAPLQAAHAPHFLD